MHFTLQCCKKQPIHCSVNLQYMYTVHSTCILAYYFSSNIRYSCSSIQKRTQTNYKKRNTSTNIVDGNLEDKTSSSSNHSTSVQLNITMWQMLCIARKCQNLMHYSNLDRTREVTKITTILCTLHGRINGGSCTPLAIQ